LPVSNAIQIEIEFAPAYKLSVNIFLIPSKRSHILAYDILNERQPYHGYPAIAARAKTLQYQPIIDGEGYMAAKTKVMTTRDIMKFTACIRAT
jgi:hypothetical protein